MANETVLFKRGDSATITSTPVTDGQILFDTSGNGKMYLDNGTDRLEMGGAITVDASLSKTSTNAIQNKAVTGNILNSLAEVSAATQQNTIAGALALKEVNDSLGGFTPVIDDTGKIIGYKTTIGGADTVFPFKSNNFGNFDITGWTITKDENAVGDISSNGLWFYAKTNSDCGICIYKSIDLTNVNSITIKTLNTSDFFTYYLKKDKPNPGSYGSKATAIDYGWAETVIDTSALTGVYYFGICNAFRTVFSFLYDFVLN